MQHMEETGQEFDDAIFSELWEETYGQPWLVNVLGQEITWSTHVMISTQGTEWYVTKNRVLDMPKLPAAFHQFFRTHADTWIEGFSYKEAGSQLLLQAFLQRIVNGGCHINREYGLGRKTTPTL